jgi:hypothetical protein
VSRSPLKRLVAIIALIAMLPIGYLLVVGHISVVDAAIRAGMTLLAAIVVNYLAGLGISAMATSMERQSAVPRRRTTDFEGEAGS